MKYLILVRLDENRSFVSDIVFDTEQEAQSEIDRIEFGSCAKPVPIFPSMPDTLPGTKKLTMPA